MDNYIYNLVKTYHKTLTPDEQYERAYEVRQSCDTILEACYLHDAAREVILNTLTKTSNIAKLGRDYNSAILGHNKSIHNRIKETIDKLTNVMLIEGSVLLRKANLHPRIVLNKEINEALKVKPGWQGKRVHAELAKLQTNRNDLVNCVLEAAAEIAVNRHKQLNSEVIQESDLFQEALKAAHEGTLLYNHDSKAKWSSFAYSRMYDIVSNFIADKSRIVCVPRSTIERFNFVIKAIAATQSIDPKTLMEYANKLITSEKANTYTEEEIETILSHMQTPISLDSGFGEDDEKNPASEFIVVDTKPEDEISKIMLQRNVAGALRARLSPLQYEIIDSLWGLTDNPRDLNETFSRVTAKFPNKKLSKIHVKRIADKVLLKMKDDKNLQMIWKEL